MRASRRAILAGSLGLLGVGLTRPLEAALRVPRGGVLRLPLPAPRTTLSPSRASDLADAWPLALVHEGLAVVGPDGAARYALLSGPPTVDRGDARVAVLSLRPGVTFSNGAPLTAPSVVASWQAARAGPLGRLVLAMCATQNPFTARSETELELRLAAPGLLDEVVCAWPFSVLGPRGAGLGPFAARGADGAVLERNPSCPSGAPFLERVELAPPRARNDEVRAFATGALDASWRAAGLYEVSRPSQRVRGAPAAVVGIIPTSRGILDRADHARALEQALSPLSNGDEAPLGPVGLASPGGGDVAALARGVPRLRLAREGADAFLNALAERVVALLDEAHLQVVLVGPTEPSDATLRAVAPVGVDASLALGSFLAVAGDEAGASAMARTPRAARAPVARGAWGRTTAAVLGRASPTLHVRAELTEVRFDPAGRLLLGDAWLARAARP